MAKKEKYNIDEDLVFEFKNKYTSKDYKRIQDIIDKADGDIDKEIMLARKQANLIRNIKKARARCVVSYDMGHYDLSEQFYNRWLELEFPRKFKLKMYLEELDDDE